jgi:hypothetical protein
VASLSLTDATTWIGGYDFTTNLNEISLNTSVDDLDATTFGGGGYRARKGGLRTVESSLAGFWESATLDAPDPQIFTNIGTADRVVTMAYDDAETSTAYMFQAGKFSYDMFGEVGALTPFNVSMMGTNPVGLVRGQVTKAKANVSATGATGTGVNLGNVSASQYLYATLHVFSAGTTITVTVQSDDNAGFTTPTTRITFGPITTVGGTWGVRLAGALAETHYRFNVTAITGTFSVAGAIGIGS